MSVYLRFMRSRAFIFTFDALLSFAIAISLSNALIFFLDQSDSLNREYLYQLSQDVMEVCSIKFDFSKECFGILDQTSKIHYSFFKNGVKEFGEDGKAEIVIKRRFSDNEIELRTWT